ncbi:MAG: alpha/beta fold hydrolase [Pseudomonadota bacterium]
MTWTTRPRSELCGLAAITAGAGSDVLLLHGVGLRAEAWGAQIDALATSYRVTALDLPGHGESPLGPKSGTITVYVQAAARVLKTLPRPALVVGHSMGAMLALELGARWPAQVAGVAALNAVFERTDAAARAVQDRAAELDGTTPADPTATLNRWFGAQASLARDACEGWLKTVAPAAYQDAYTAFAHSRTPDRALLARLNVPALFMTGSLEPNSTRDMSRAMAAIAPKGSAYIVEGAAHMMPMTHAAEVNAALRHLVQQVHV